MEGPGLGRRTQGYKCVASSSGPRGKTFREFPLCKMLLRFGSAPSAVGSMGPFDHLLGYVHRALVISTIGRLGVLQAGFPSCLRWLSGTRAPCQRSPTTRAGPCASCAPPPPALEALNSPTDHSYAETWFMMPSLGEKQQSRKSTGIPKQSLEGLGEKLLSL